MSTREELAKVLGRELGCVRVDVEPAGLPFCGEHHYGWLSTGECPVQERVTESLLASPALANLIREKQAEAGMTREEWRIDGAGGPSYAIDPRATEAERWTRRVAAMSPDRYPVRRTITTFPPVVTDWVRADQAEAEETP